MKTPVQTVLFDSNTHQCNCILDNGWPSHSKRHYMLIEYCGSPAQIVVELGECIAPGFYRAFAVFAYQCLYASGQAVDISKLIPLDSRTNNPLPV